MQQTTGRAALVANNLPSTKTVTAATNATPIVVTTSAIHKLNTNEIVTITGALGNTAAHGTFVAVVLSSTTFALTTYPGGANVAGTGAWTSGGTVQSNGYGKTVPVPNDLTDAMRAGGINVPFEAGIDRESYLLLRAQQLESNKVDRAGDTMTGLLIVDAGITLPLGAPLSMSAGSTSSVNTEWTLGASVITKVITNATNATPIVVTTSAAHGFLTGDQITVESVGGNTAANGQWVIKFLSGTTFSLVGSVGSGAYTSGGDCYRLPMEAFNAARSVVRALTDSFNSGYSEAGAVTQQWNCDSGGEFASTNSSPTTIPQYFGFDIDIPQGSSLVSATIYMQPSSGHGGVPGSLPTVTVHKIALSTNTLSILATQTLGGVDPAYQGVTATLGTAEVIDRTRYKYNVILTTETGVNALDNTHVMGGACAFTARHEEQF